MSENVIHVDVLLFAQLRDAVGAGRIVLNMPEGSTVADAVRELGRRHEVIDALLQAGALAYALNARYTLPTGELTRGCTLALIPPVSGG